MNIIFEYADKKLTLPVNPANVKVNKPSPSQKVEVIGVGEVSVPQKRKLASVSISSFFWNDLFSQKFLGGLGGSMNFIPASIRSGIMSEAMGFADKGKDFIANKLLNSGNFTGFVTGAVLSNTSVGGFIEDSQKFEVLNEYVKWFEEWQASKLPARWTIVVPPNDPPQCFDFYVTCENFSYEVKAGEDSDYYYEIELLEWRDYGAKVMTEETQADGSTKFVEKNNYRLDVKAEIAPGNIEATEKDSIWSVSKKWCKDNWKDLAKEGVNKTILANSPQNITGMTLKIPNKFNRTIS